MYTLKVPIRKANPVKLLLVENKLYDKNRVPLIENGYIYFPVLKIDKTYEKGGEFCSKILASVESKCYQNLLLYNLPQKIIDTLPNSYDIIGNIIIIEIREDIAPYEKKIGNALLDLHKSIKTVLKKTGIHEGEFRTQRYECIAGIDTREAMYRENGVILKLDVEKVYFSPRLSTERKRIFKQVKRNEKVLVMFSGCAPYPITISKNSSAKRIVGIEKNEIAHKYGLKNLELNKIKNTELICEDVRIEVPKLKEKFDRIVMPLPKDADTFLDVAFKVAKKGTIIHLYDFEHETELEKGSEKVESACKTNKLRYKIHGVEKCGQYSPGKFRICVDFEIL